MSSDSMIYTIGTALNRARDNDIPVRVLVDGEWLSGRVLAVDGFGVVLHCEDLEHAVVRMESVAAVRVLSAAPGRAPIEAGVAPMPGPRPAWD